MEDFYIGSASVKRFLPLLKMNFPEIVSIALPSKGVFPNLVFVSIKKTYPMQAYQIMHGLWGMGQRMFTQYLTVVDDDVDAHKYQPGPLPPLRPYRPATRLHLHQRTGQRARPCRQRARRRHQTGHRRHPETPGRGLPPPLAAAHPDG